MTDSLSRRSASPRAEGTSEAEWTPPWDCPIYCKEKGANARLKCHCRAASAGAEGEVPPEPTDTDSALSRFIRTASPEEKERVYAIVMQRAAESQRAALAAAVPPAGMVRMLTDAEIQLAIFECDTDQKWSMERAVERKFCEVNGLQIAAAPTQPTTGAA